MVIVVEAHNSHSYRGLLRQMFEMRSRIFHGKLAWDVDVSEGQERDKYDAADPVYLIHTDETGKANGSLRLLPTTGPTLLADVFFDTLPDAALLSAPSIWECTRFCIDADADDPDRGPNTLTISSTLIETMGQMALRAGITTILGNFAPGMLRIYRRIGCTVEILGCTRRFGVPVFLGSFPVSEACLTQVRIRSQQMRLGGASASMLAA